MFDIRGTKELYGKHDTLMQHNINDCKQINQPYLSLRRLSLSAMTLNNKTIPT